MTHFGWSALHLTERWSLSTPRLEQTKSCLGGFCGVCGRRDGTGSSNCTAGVLGGRERV